MKASYSAISTYLGCRYKYGARYRDGLRPIAAAPQFEVGSIVHGALECVLTAHALSERLPQADAAVRWACAKLREKRKLTIDSEESSQHAIRALEYHVPRMRLESWDTLWHNDAPAVELELAVPFGGVTLQAHIDWVAVSKETGKTWIIDHKTSKHRMQDRPWVEFDLQLALYREACRIDGIEAHGALLHQLCYIPPSAPKQLKKRAKVGHLFSVAKNQRTDWETYQNALIAAGEDPADYQAVKDMLDGQCEKAPFRRWAVDITDDQGHAAMMALAREAIDGMRQIKYHGAESPPSRTGEFNCGRCEYRAICDATLAGLDPRSLVNTVYRPDDDAPLASAPPAEGIAALRKHTHRLSACGIYNQGGFSPHA